MKLFCWIACTIVFISSTETFAYKDNKDTTSSYEKGEIIVMLKSNDHIRYLMNDLSYIGHVKTSISIKSQLVKSMNIWLVGFDDAVIDDDRILELIRNKPYVSLAQFNHNNIELRGTVPNDAKYTNQWHHKKIGSELAWDISTGGITADGDTVVVAVIDGGGGRGHIDMKYYNNYHEIPDNGIDDDQNGYIDDFLGWNAVNDNDSISGSGHAGLCSGSIGAIGNNTEGVVGICWNVQIMAIQSLWKSGSSNAQIEAQLIKGYGYIRDVRELYNDSKGAKGAFVVATNNSFGVNYGKAADFPIWCAFYDSLAKVGILSTGSTANFNVNVDNSGDMPTTCKGDFIIGVMSATSADIKPNGTGFDASVGKGWGPISVDLAAPSDVYTTSGLKNYTYTGYGTSFASPHVTGSIALLISGFCPMLLADYKLYPDSILRLTRKFLLENVDTPIGFKGLNATNGRLNIGKAMLAMDAYCTTLSLKENSEIHGSLSLFPNPTKDNIYINIKDVKQNNWSYTISDVCGKIILTDKISFEESTNSTIETRLLNSGIYFVSVSNNSQSFRLKFIKQ